MSHRQRKEHENALQWYDPAAGWMEKNRPNDPEFAPFRAEAARLLGVADTKAPVKKDGR